MPTYSELKALINNDNCDVEWTTVNGVNGRKFTGKADSYKSNSVFLPAAESCNNGYVKGNGTYGNYWSSMPSGVYAFGLHFFRWQSQEVFTYDRKYGYSVRAVLAE